MSGTALEKIDEYAGDNLVEGILGLVETRRPLLVYLVGGEPLVRYRELSVLLPELCSRGIKVEVVTSAVRPIPAEWSRLEDLTVVVSIDGLQPEHDARRKPATYDRILSHIEGHNIVVHCTVTGQMTRKPGYLAEFVEFWNRPEVVRIRMSLFTPQIGESREEVLSPEDRRRVVADLGRLHRVYPKLRLTTRMLDAYLKPPTSPERCIFARATGCVSSDLKTLVLPCQFGGSPDCSQCGCAATAGMEAIGQFRLAGVRLGAIYDFSLKIGSLASRMRRFLGRAGSALETVPAAGVEPGTDDSTP